MEPNKNDPQPPKRFINEPTHAVDEMLQGFLVTHERLVDLVGSRCVVRRDRPAGAVAVIAGGGSGHEPALIGYVGAGMLDAVVVGDLFASPPVPLIVEAIDAVDNGRGVLLLIGNYAGDVLNFEIAAQRARAAGHDVITQVVSDDVGMGRFNDLRTRRGMGGSFFIWKACGAAAAAGGTLDALRDVARTANDHVRTVAVAHTPLTLPGAAHPSFIVAHDEYQFGVGHGEPGIRREAMRPVDAIVDEMVSHLLADGLPSLVDQQLITLVNGLGAVPLMELYIAQRRLREDLRDRGLSVVRSYVGPFYTAVNMGGFSISLLDADPDILGWIDAPARTPHFVQ